MGAFVLAKSGDIGMSLALNAHSEYLKWREVWCSRIDVAANFCQWAGIVCNVLCCALLLGLYFQYNYPSTPLMWKLYVSILALGLCIGLPAVFIWRCFSGPQLRHAQTLQERLLDAHTDIAAYVV